MRSALRLAAIFLVFVGQPSVGARRGASPARTRTVVNARDFGANGDGRADDTAAVQAALSSGNDVFVPAGTYVVANVQPVSNQRLFGEGLKSVLKQRIGAAYVISINPGNAGTADPSTNVRNVTISDLTLYGLAELDGFSGHRHLMNLNAVSEVLIENCTFIGFQGDGLYLGSSNVAGVERHNTRVTIRGNTFDGVNHKNRNGISIIDGDGVLIERNRFVHASRADMPGAIDIEPNESFSIVRNITIRGNEGETGGGVGFIALHLSRPTSDYSITPHNIIVEDNRVWGSPGLAFVANGDATESSPPLGLVLRRNRVIEPKGRGLKLGGVRGVVAVDNYIVRPTKDVLLGFEGHAVVDVELRNNTFEFGDSGTGNGMMIGGATRVSIVGNTFREIVGNGVTFGRGRSEGVTITSNTFVGAPGRMARSVITLPGHRTVEASNVVTGNVLRAVAPPDFPAASR